MKLEITTNSLRIVPESGMLPDTDERDLAFIESVLGLLHDGDSIKLTRKNCLGLSCIKYLETSKEKK